MVPAKEKVVKEQEKLISILKGKYSGAYEWMMGNNIDPKNLGAHAAGITAALVVSMGAIQEKEVPQLLPVVEVIEVDELIGKSQEEKASLVWRKYGNTIKRASAKYDLDPKLIASTIMIESGGNTFAQRYEPHINDSSYGLGQILYGTATIIGFDGAPNKLFDPEVNIELIARYHARNRDVYGKDLTNEQLTAIYNTGSLYSNPLPGHVEKFRNWYKIVGKVVG